MDPGADDVKGRDQRDDVTVVTAERILLFYLVTPSRRRHFAEQSNG